MAWCPCGVLSLRNAHSGPLMTNAAGVLVDSAWCVPKDFAAGVPKDYRNVLIDF